MPTKRRTKMPEEQLLGEIETWIAGMQYYDATVGAGEQVNLEREPDNRHDPCSIRVENGRCQPVGQMPREIVAWLAPLIDSDQVHIEGYVPHSAAPSSQHRGSLPLALAIFLSPSRTQLLAQRKVRNKLDALHEVVRRSYEDAVSYVDTKLIDGLVEGLRPLARQQLLPESRMLLAILPEMAREKQVAQSIRGMARLRELVGIVQIGDPLHHGTCSDRRGSSSRSSRASSMRTSSTACTVGSGLLRPGADEAGDFLDQVAARASPRVPALGEGIELEIQAGQVVGSALLYCDQLCHLAAFSTVF